jgi:hypothetical protein
MPATRPNLDVMEQPRQRGAPIMAADGDLAPSLGLVGRLHLVLGIIGGVADRAARG